MKRIQYNHVELKRHIKAARMTDAQIAAAVGCHRVTLSRAKNGHCASLELLARIAREIHVPLSEILMADSAKIYASVVSAY